MCLDRRSTDVQGFRNLVTGSPSGDQREHFALALGEANPVAYLAPPQLLGKASLEHRRHHDFAAVYGSYGRGDVLDVLVLRQESSCSESQRVADQGAMR